MKKTEVKKNSTQNLIREMPHNLEAERAILGCMIMDVVLQVEVSSSLHEEDFYAESHRYIFNAMMEIISANQPVDVVTLLDMLEKQGTLEQAGGIAYITEMTNVLPSTANYMRYLDIVTRDSMLRKIIRGSADIIDNSMSSTDKVSSLAYAEKTIFDISNTADTSSMVKVGSVIPAVMNMFDELSKDKSSFKGLMTQFRGVDKLLNGLHGSELIVLAARPAVGKTSFAMNIVENAALQGYSCAVFSLEMGKEQLVQRMMCSVAGVKSENALKGVMNKKEWLNIAKARELLSNAKIFIDDSAAVTPQELLSKCRRLKRKHGLDLIMVDYIQLMSSGSTKKDDNRQQEVSEISRNLKLMAKELNVPVIALSQLSRQVESRGGRPTLADLRESGAIEQDADVVMFIHRPDKDKKASEKDFAEGKIKKNVAEIIVEKHRSGPTGIIELYFKGEYTKFCNYNPDTGEIEGDVVEDEPKEKNDTAPNGTTTDTTNNSDSVEAPFDVDDGETERNDNVDENGVPKSIDDEMFE